MDLENYGRTLRDRWRWVAFFVLAGVLAALVVALSAPQKFVSTTQLFLATPGFSSLGSIATSDTSPYQADQYSQNRAQSYVQLATRTDLAQRAVTKLGIAVDPQDVADSTEARVKPDTVLIEVTVKAESASQSKVLADAVTAELAADIRAIETPAGSLIPTVDPIVTRSADVPSDPSEPAVPIHLLVGASLGLLLGVTAAAVAARPKTELQREEV